MVLLPYSNGKTGVCYIQKCHRSVAFATARETTYRSLNNEGETQRSRCKPAISLRWFKSFRYLWMNPTLNKSTNLTPFGYAVDGKMGYAPQGALYKGKNDKKVYTMDVKGDFAKNFGDISTESVVGFQAFQTINKSMDGGGQQFPGPGLQVLGALGSNSAGSGFSEVIEAGLMMQTRIGYWTGYTLLPVLDKMRTVHLALTSAPLPIRGLMYLSSPRL
ncbi:MAG: hypothetical protein Ct9H300mP29_2420 [Candidatus Neomarinimicrobiota bacterium]|nr:MAG: hypothetical protein Ct9H300mP29_2420 [Candidatus Neomarinimicrobiota bacterium]